MELQLEKILKNISKIANAISAENIPYVHIGLASQNPVIVKGSASILETVTAFNLNAAPVYLKLYDQRTSPVSTDTPVQVYMIPGNTAGAGYTIKPRLKFNNGLAFRMVGGMAHNNTTNTVASEQIINLSYSE